MARNRALVLDTLEKALRDPNVTPGAPLFQMVVRLRELASTPELAGNVRQAYLAELVASLPQRSGRSQTESLKIILANLPTDPAQAAPTLTALREALIANFDRFQPEQMLAEYWDLFRDPRLVSGLETILRGPTRTGFFRLLAIQRLLELAPEQARTFVAAEIGRPARFDDIEAAVGILSGVKPPLLPQVDEPLLAIIRDQAPSQRRSPQLLAQKGVLAARFATDAIYDGLREVYLASSGLWRPEDRGGVLSYLVRVRQSDTMQIIEHELAALGPFQEQTFLDYLTLGNYSAGVRGLLTSRLQGDDLQVAGFVALLMGKHGIAEDQAVLEKRLRQWRDLWASRESSMGAPELTFEGQLVSALTRKPNLVRHRVNHVIDADADAESRELLRIFGIVGVLPGVAQIHIVADGHHQAMMLVIHAAPVRLVAVVFVSPAGTDILLAGYLIAVVQIVDRMEDGVVVGDVHHFTVGKDTRHAGHEDFPLLGAVEVIAHEEATAVQILAESLHLRVGQVPMAHFHRIKPGPVVLVAQIEIDGLLHGTRVNPRQAP
jgi:hypothetical protein